MNSCSGKSRKIYTYLYIVNRLGWQARGNGTLRSDREGFVFYQRKERSRSFDRYATFGGQEAAFPASERHGRDRIGRVGIVGVLSPAAGDGCRRPD
jgi:hypothetical protein